jgi:hypothetical protein
MCQLTFPRVCVPYYRTVVLELSEMHLTRKDSQMYPSLPTRPSTHRPTMDLSVTLLAAIQDLGIKRHINKTLLTAVRLWLKQHSTLLRVLTCSW